MMGWIANVFLLTASIIIGRKWRSGFILSLIGQIIWFTISIQREAYDLAFMCIAFSIICVVNWFSWSSDRTAASVPQAGEKDEEVSNELV